MYADTSSFHGSNEDDLLPLLCSKHSFLERNRRLLVSFRNAVFWWIKNVAGADVHDKRIVHVACAVVLGKFATVRVVVAKQEVLGVSRVTA